MSKPNGQRWTGAVEELGSFYDVLPDTVQDADLYLYTQHHIWRDEQGVVQQTRSSPNWEGGLVTFATCKHMMRTWRFGQWQGAWIAGLNPSSLGNSVLFFGRVSKVFDSNFELSRTILSELPDVYKVKEADTNPRGDLYTPRRLDLVGDERFMHQNFHEPPNHTRSTEMYDKSPGSAPGPVPKWWRDIEYISPRRVRPPSFILNPCYLFPTRVFKTTFQPGRASLRLTVGRFVNSLTEVVHHGNQS